MSTRSVTSSVLQPNHRLHLDQVILICAFTTSPPSLQVRKQPFPLDPLPSNRKRGRVAADLAGVGTEFHHLQAPRTIQQQRLEAHLRLAAVATKLILDHSPVLKLDQRLHLVNLKREPALEIRRQAGLVYKSPVSRDDQDTRLAPLGALRTALGPIGHDLRPVPANNDGVALPVGEQLLRPGRREEDELGGGFWMLASVRGAEHGRVHAADVADLA